MFFRALYYLFQSDQSWINRYSISNHFLESYQPLNRHGEHPFTKNLSDERKINGKKALKEIIGLTFKYDINLKFYISPYLHQYIKAFKEDHELFKKEIENIIGSDLKIWDYSDDLLNTIYFADPLHMNLKGFRALSKILLEDDFYKKR